MYTITNEYGYSFHKDGTMKGIKPYLSYSAIDLWEKNKPEYRKRYYEGAPAFTSPFTIFGNEIHKQVEEGVLDIGLPTTVRHEVRLEGSIDGVHVLGYLDILDESIYEVTDIKTSINPWTQVMVEKLEQLVLYQLLVKENYDKCSRKAHVVWLPTRWTAPESESKDVKGFSMECTTSEPQLELAGEPVKFTRTIQKWERDRVREKIVRVAKEIQEDFNNYRNT